MKIYRIVDVISGQAVAEKNHCGDQAARNWLSRLLARGAISGVAVRLQRRAMTDAAAGRLPPFAGGQKQTPWTAI